MNHFFDESVTGAIRLQISSFSQAPVESLRASWLRFRSYQRECPQHGFQEIQLINIFYKGIDKQYQNQLDAASSCNFMTRTISEALLLITNALTCLSTQGFDKEQRISAEIATASKETPISAISAPIQAPPLHPNQKPELSLCLRSFLQASQKTRMESMFTQLLAGLTKLDSKYESLSTKLDSKYDSLSTDINSKIDNLRSQFSNLSPTSASINAVTLRSGKQLNPILQRERSSQPSSFPIAENESVSIDTPGFRSTPITLEDSVFPLSSGIDNFAEEEETIPDGVDRHLVRSDNVQILAATKSENRRIPFPKSPKKSRQALDNVRCKAMIDKLIVEMPLVEAIHLSPTIRRYVKTMVIKNLTKECSVMMISEQGSDNIQEQIPKKLPDPGTFVLSVTINHDSFPRALCDLGSSVNLMPRSVAMRLGYSNLEPTDT